MELEEMKSIWAEMSGQLDKQKRITDKLIITMTQERYKKALNSVGTPEKIASVMCFGFAVLMLINFNKYQSIFMVVCALTSIAFMFLLPIVSLRAIRKMNNLNVQGNNMKQTLTDFAKRKTDWLSIQRWSLYLTPVLIATILPVMLVILGGDESKLRSSVWFWYLPISMLFYILISRWVYGHYIRATVRMENVLKELEE